MVGLGNNNYEDSISQEDGSRIASIIADHVGYTQSILDALSETVENTLVQAYNDKLATVAKRLESGFREAVSRSNRTTTMFGLPKFDDDSITEFYKNTEFHSNARHIQTRINDEVVKYYSINVSTSIKKQEDGRTSAKEYERMVNQLEALLNNFINQSEGTIMNLKKYQDNPSYAVTINKIILIIDGAIKFLQGYVKNLGESIGIFIDTRHKTSLINIDSGKEDEKKSASEIDDFIAEMAKEFEEEFKS